MHFMLCWFATVCPRKKQASATTKAALAQLQQYVKAGNPLLQGLQGNFGLARLGFNQVLPVVMLDTCHVVMLQLFEPLQEHPRAVLQVREEFRRAVAMCGSFKDWEPCLPRWG